MYGSRKNNMVHPADGDDNYFFGENYEFDFSRDARLQIGSPHLNSSQNGSKAASQLGSQASVFNDEIQALTTCDQLYLYQANKVSSDVASNYDIRNGEGKLIFKALESVDPIVKDLRDIHDQTKPPFVLSIIDFKTGKEVMKINGNLARGIMKVYVRDYNRDKIIGLVRRVDERCGLCCPPTFSLERPNGAVLLRVRSSLKSLLSCCCLCTCRLTAKFQTRFFNVYLPDDLTYIGVVKHHRKKFNDEVDPEANKTKAVLGAAIPEDSTSTNKALLLASMFMLDYVYFQKNRRSLKCPKISKTCTIVIVIFVVVGIIGLMALLFGGGGYAGNKTSKGRPVGSKG